MNHLVKARLPTRFGEFDLHLFKKDELEIPVLAQLQKIESQPLIRVHSSCVTGDIFHSLRCDCGEQRDLAMQKIESRGGLFIYLPQEGRGIGLHNKIKAYALQDNEKLDTVEANLKLSLPVDARNYDSVREILHFFEIRECVLLTNNPLKIKALEAAGIGVEREALRVLPNAENQVYLETKSKKLGHL